MTMLGLSAANAGALIINVVNATIQNTDLRCDFFIESSCLYGLKMSVEIVNINKVAIFKKYGSYLICQYSTDL